MSLSGKELDAIDDRALRIGSVTPYPQVRALVAELRAARAENEKLRAALRAIVDAYPFRSTGIFMDARSVLAAVGLEEETEATR